MHILEVKGLKKTFAKGKTKFTAVDGVSFHVDKGECVGLVGESGCGKSTVAKMITRLTDVSDGHIYMNGEEVTHCKGKERREYYRQMQMVFQMPTDSFNPRMKLGSSIAQAMTNFGMPKAEAKEKVPKLLDIVGLKREYADRYPHQISGGECQRAALARALAVGPKLLICDEATSALDVSVQAQIVALIQELQEKIDMSYLFICHDLALVQNICNRVMVMHRGTIVEAGATNEVICDPKHPYTKLLLSSVFPVEPDSSWQPPKLEQRVEPEGEGCKFWERCPHCTERCKREKPNYVAVKQYDGEQNREHDVSCFLFYDR
ncbi:MAG: ABC transporter ATP-binding protein [Oscillospiraceae bacterium]|nr:ABC transporter ATP-binding protein [Oscillospiraceae bacterium]